MKRRLALLAFLILLATATFALANESPPPPSTTLARLRAGHERVMDGGPRAARLPADEARRPSVAVVMPADWGVSVADLLDVYPQDVLRIDADDPQRGEAVGEAVARLGVRVIVALEPDAAAARSQAARLRTELSTTAAAAAARVEPARLDSATGRIDWLGDAVTTLTAPAAPAAPKADAGTGLPWAAVPGVALAAGLIVVTRRPDWARAGRELLRAKARGAAVKLRDRFAPPRPAPEAEAAAEVERIRRDNPRLFAVLGRLQESQHPGGAEPGLAVATDRPGASLHALVAAERYIPAALSGGKVA